MALACTCLQEEKDERLFLEFGLFESNNREHERARIIYKFGLDSLPKHLCQDLYKQYVSFEKQHGDQKNIEDVIVDKRRTQYEDAVAANPHNYDAWFDYIRLEESEANLVRHLRMVCCTVVDLCPPSAFPVVLLCHTPVIYSAACCTRRGRTRSVTFTSGLWPMCRLSQRSSTGAATCTCGSTTRCLRSLMRGTSPAHGKFTSTLVAVFGEACWPMLAPISALWQAHTCVVVGWCSVGTGLR